MTSRISITPTGNTPVTEKEPGSRKNDRLQGACELFEAYFIEQLMNESQEQLSSDGIIPRSEAQQTFQEMLNETYAMEMSHARGFGLAEMLYRQISASMGDRQEAMTAKSDDRLSLAKFSMFF